MENKVGQSRPQSDVSNSTSQPVFDLFEDVSLVPSLDIPECSDGVSKIDQSLRNFLNFVEQLAPEHSWLQVGFVHCGEVKELFFDYSIPDKNGKSVKFMREEIRGKTSEIAERMYEILCEKMKLNDPSEG